VNTSMAFSMVLMASLAQVFAAPVRGSWDEVRILEKGEQIRITSKDNETTTGTFRRLDTESLLFTTGDTERTLPKAEVQRVEVKAHGRMKNALIGAGIGLGLGIALDQTGGAHARNETGQTAAARAALIGLPVGIAGGLSALIPSYKTAYQDPK